MLSPQISYSQPECTNDIVTTRVQQLPQAGWQIERDQQKMKIYNRKTAGNPIREILVLTTIELPASWLFAAVSDYSRYPQFMPYVIKSEVVRQQDNKTWVFQELDLPWPIANRHYTIELTSNVSQQAQGHYLLNWTLSRIVQPSLAGSGVKLEFDDGYWRFCSLGERTTFVEYYIHSDPGGLLPSWAVNQANTRAVPEVLKAVQRRAIKTEKP